MVCGGDYYDRDVYEAPAPSSSNSRAPVYSNVGNQAMRSTRKLHKSCDPSRFKEEYLTCKQKNAIIFALDVTGSMGNWSKIIYDKLPMFYGQIMTQKYLEDPSICFAGVGDAYSDEAPLQVTEFAQGKEIDQVITKIWLEGFGGGNDHESYALASYFFLSRTDISESSLPFLFLSGDEGFYPEIRADHIRDVLGLEQDKDLDTRLVFEEVKRKFKGNVFLLKKPYIDDDALETRVLKEWKEVLGDEHVLFFEEPKAIIDICLGVISIVSGSRTLEQYCEEDMKNRDQSTERVRLVNQVLLPLAEWVEESKNKGGRVGGGLSVPRIGGDDEDEVDEEEEEDPVFVGGGGGGGGKSGGKYFFDPKKLVKKRQIKTDCYGIIPVKFDKNRGAVVLVLQHENGKHWDFCKGHAAKEEIAGKQTAERELKEETGLSVKKYLTDQEFNRSYTIDKYNDCVIHKTVHWFVAEVEGDVEVEKDEILDHEWIVVSQVEERITFENQKTLFAEVKEFIKEEEEE